VLAHNAALFGIPRELPMTEFPLLVLNAQADRRIKKGHLWIYSNEVNTAKTPLKGFAPGDLAEVCSAGGQSLGLAFINPNALICGRLLTRDSRQRLDTGFLRSRITQALHLREMCFSEPYYRLVYGDSDLLPGVVIDRYGDYLVVQISVAGFDRLLEDLLAALEQVLQPKGIVVRNNHSARELEELEEQVRIVGAVPDTLALVENGARFEVSATTGQKTGWFYDHRVNRAALQNLVRGRRVLDVFSYMGGWGVEAGIAGARHVTCVDASEAAVEGVRHNAALNGIADKVEAVRGKAVDVLKNLVADKSQFDVVVLDPPAFIKKRKDQAAGEAAYRHINELAIRLLGKEGLLVSASCSMPLTRDILQEIVRGAARHLDRQAQLIYSGGQGPDHPIHPAIPETDYLKAQFYRAYLE
jgi:23S rRNA (cytosine1962-C5)-methyltransferase